MGEHTLLMDGDLRSPSQHALFGLRNSSGLSTILSDRADVQVVQRIPAFVDLSVLPAGPTPPNPLELLGKPRFADLMQALGKEYDWKDAEGYMLSLGRIEQGQGWMDAGEQLLERISENPEGFKAKVAAWKGGK
jgi:hypothetical protein